MITRTLFAILFFVVFSLFSGFPTSGVCVILVFASLDQSTIRILGTHWALLDVGLVLFLAGAAFRVAVSHDKPHPVRSVLFALALWAWLSTLFGLHTLSSVQAAFRLCLDLTVFYFIAQYTASSRHHWMILLTALATVLLSVMLSIPQLHNYLIPNKPFHLRGGFSNWNTYAMFLACFMPFFLLKAKITRKPLYQTLWRIIFIICLQSELEL